MEKMRPSEKKRLPGLSALARFRHQVLIKVYLNWNNYAKTPSTECPIGSLGEITETRGGEKPEVYTGYVW